MPSETTLTLLQKEAKKQVFLQGTVPTQFYYKREFQLEAKIKCRIPPTSGQFWVSK